MDNKKIIRKLRFIGYKLKKLYQNSGAIQVYRSALALINGADISVLINLGEIYNLMGKYNEAIKSYYYSIRIKTGAWDSEDLAGIHRRLANVYLNRGNYTRALKHINRCLETIGRNESKERIKIYSLKANLYFQRGDYKKAIEISASILNNKDNLDNCKEIAFLYYIFGIASSHLGDFSVSEIHIKKAWDIYKKLRDLNGEAMVLGGLGSLYQRRGDLQQAVEYYNESLVINKKIGDKNNMATTLMNLGTISHELCDYSHAIRYYKASIKMANLMGIPVISAKAKNNLGMLYLYLGKIKDARSEIQQSLRLSKRLYIKQILGLNYYLLGYVHCIEEDFSSAKKYYLKALNVFSKIESKRELCLVEMQITDMYCEAGDSQNAEKYFKRAIKHARELNSLDLVMQSNLLRAKIDGQKREVNVDFVFNIVEKAKEYFQTTGQWEMLSNSYYEGGRLLKNKGELKEARLYFDSAKNVIEDVASSLSEFFKRSYLEDKRRRWIYQEIENLIIDDANKKAIEQSDFVEEDTGSEIIGKSQSMLTVIKTIDKIAHSTATVLITGETGTGKELVAKEIHRLSKGTKKPFIPVHCASLSENLLESKLFGHEKGAFTGAVGLRIGLFELADGGTLFLDEIGDIPLHLQAKLIRFIQEKTFMRVGSNRDIKVDTRIICATNKNLWVSVKKGKFREDLYYRINIMPIKIPPLRERKEDISILALHILKQYSHKMRNDLSYFSQEVMDWLNNYDYPGNVRELRNIVEQLVILADKKDNIINIDLLSKLFENGILTKMRRAPLSIYPDTKLDEVEQEMIKKALEMSKGNVTQAAKILGVHRFTIYRKMKLMGIKRNGKSDLKKKPDTLCPQV